MASWLRREEPLPGWAVEGTMLTTTLITTLLLRCQAPITDGASAMPSPLDRSIATILDAHAARVTLDADDAELADIVGRLSQAGVVLRADWPALERLGIDPDDRIGFEVRDLTVYDAAVAFSRAIGDESERPVVDAAPGQLVLTTEHALGGMREAALYDVADIVTDATLLAGTEDPSPTATADTTTDEERAARLVELILDHVDPQSWLEQGGSRGRISREAGRIVVSATPATHLRLRRFLSELRDESPLVASVRLHVLAVPTARADRIVEASAGDAHAQALALVSAPEATRLWAPHVLTRLGETASVETSGATASFSATVIPTRDRIARVLSVQVTLDATVAGVTARFEGTVASMGDSPVWTALEVPMAVAPTSEPATTWFLVVDARAVARERSGGS